MTLNKHKKLLKEIEKCLIEKDAIEENFDSIYLLARQWKITAYELELVLKCYYEEKKFMQVSDEGIEEIRPKEEELEVVSEETNLTTKKIKETYKIKFRLVLRIVVAMVVLGFLLSIPMTMFKASYTNNKEIAIKNSNEQEDGLKMDIRIKEKTKEINRIGFSIDQIKIEGVTPDKKDEIQGHIESMSSSFNQLLTKGNKSDKDKRAFIQQHIESGGYACTTGLDTHIYEAGRKLIDAQGLEELSTLNLDNRIIHFVEAEVEESTTGKVCIKSLVIILTEKA